MSSRTSIMRTITSVVLALSACTSNDSLECGEGTHEEAGKCVPDVPDVQPDGSYELHTTEVQMTEGACRQDELSLSATLEIAGGHVTITKVHGISCDTADGFINVAGDFTGSCSATLDGETSPFLTATLNGTWRDGGLTGTVSFFEEHSPGDTCTLRAGVISR